MNTSGKSLLLILVSVFSFLNMGIAQKTTKQKPSFADTLDLPMLTFTKDERERMVDEIYKRLDLSEEFNAEEVYKTLNLNDFFGDMDMRDWVGQIDWNKALEDVDWNLLFADFDWNEMKVFMCDPAQLEKSKGLQPDSSFLNKGTNGDPMKCLGGSKNMSYMQMMEAIDQNCLLELIVKRKINFQLKPGEADMKAFCAMAECMDFNPMFKNMDWKCYFQQIDMNVIFKGMNFDDLKTGLKGVSTQDSLLNEIKNKNPLFKAVDFNKIKDQIKIDSSSFKADHYSAIYNRLFDKIITNGWLQSGNLDSLSTYSKILKLSLSMMKNIYKDTKAFKYYAVYTWLTYEATLDIQNLKFNESLTKQFLQKDILIGAWQEKLFDQLESDFGSLRATIGKDFEKITIPAIYQNIGVTYNLMGQYSKGLASLEKGASTRALITHDLPSLERIDQILQPSYLENVLDTLKKHHGITPDLFGQIQLMFIQRNHPVVIQKLLDGGKYEHAIELYLAFKDIVLQNSRTNSIFPSYVLQNKMMEKAYGLKMLKGIYDNIVSIMDKAKMQKDPRYSLYQEASSILERFEQEQRQALLYSQIGQTYYAMNNYEFGFKYLEQSHSSLENLKNLDYIQVTQPGVGDLTQAYLNKVPVYVSVNTALANIYVRRKQLDEAEQVLLNSEAWIKSRMDTVIKLSDEEFKNNLFNIYGSLGEVYLLQRRPDEAIPFFQKTKAIAQKSNKELLNYYSGFYLGNYYQQKNKLDSARIYFSEARVTAEKINFKYGMADASVRLGYVLKQQGQTSRAVELYNYGEKVAQSISYYPVLYQIHSLRAKMYEEKGDYQSALKAYDQGIRIVEDSIFNFFQGEGSRQLTLESTFDCYAGAVACALQLGQKEKAFVYVQMSKNRTLNELLAEGALRAKDIPKDLRRKRDDLLRKRNDLLVELRKIQFQYIISSDDKALKVLQDSLLEQLRILNAEIRNSIRKWSDKFNLPSETTLQAVQKLLAPAQVAVEYFAGRDLYAWVIMKDSSKVLNLGPSQEKFTEVSRFTKNFDLLREYEITEDTLYMDTILRNMDMTLSNLHTILFAPIEKSGLPVKTRELIILPDDELYRIPFESLLKSRNHYLADDYPIIRYYPSSVIYYRTATTSKLKPKTERVSDILIVSKSDFAEYDGRFDDLTIPTDFDFFEDTFKENVDYLLEEEATTQALLKIDMSKYKYIYFSTHAAMEEAPELSFLALSGGPLSLYQTFDLNLNSDVVVMDACETGGGEFQRGAGVMNFARGFMFAGARSLLISLWPVREDASAELSKNFFKHLLTGKYSAAAALAMAKKDLRAIKEYNHPFYWGAFVLFGQE